MRDLSKTSPEPVENFIEAPQLTESHRRPVAWMLGIQIVVLSLVAVWSTGLPLAVQGAALGLLVGFLWFANSFWLMSFCLVAFAGQLVHVNGLRYRFSLGVHLAECILLVLILVASYRYIELRTYGKAFGLGKSYRGLKRSGNRHRTWLPVILGQFIRRQWYYTVLAMVLAFAFLWRFPADNSWREEYWLQPNVGRFIGLSLLLFLAWFVCRAVASIWDWFLLTPQQADVAFRSWANREFWSDMAGVERRKAKLEVNDHD